MPKLIQFQFNFIYIYSTDSQQELPQGAITPDVKQVPCMVALLPLVCVFIWVNEKYMVRCCVEHLRLEGVM